ncbi:PQQ-binding-like beta-propeller repeat protein [Halocatena marina]|uniref:PQQ-binding-like beta-propeller repeat protein n=1 Tax=Halocatena marina TaxID=2934937 RepID=A0ABD5YK55_9EURY
MSTSALIANAIGSDGQFVAFFREGTEKWADEPEAGLKPTVIANETVYLGPHANTDVPLIALAAVTGETLWQKDVHRSPEIAAAGNTLFVGTDERVSAFREE